jgi:hypothetical protein
LRASGDYYGCGLSGTDKTPFAKLTTGESMGCFVYGGELMGVCRCGVILFLVGKIVGKAKQYYSDDDCEGFDEYSIMNAE